MTASRPHPRRSDKTCFHPKADLRAPGHVSSGPHHCRSDKSSDSNRRLDQRGPRQELADRSAITAHSCNYLLEVSKSK
jgi:hypothetical protein